MNARMNARITGQVLIVDDEPNAVKVLAAILQEEGHSVLEANNVENAIRLLAGTDMDAVITDMKMPGKDGMQLFEHLLEYAPDVPVIFLTAYGSVDSAVHAITLGAFYYFIKPPDYSKLKGILARAIEQRQLKRELCALKKRLAYVSTADRIVGTSPKMLKIFETIQAVKDTQSSVLICGETGTGKELIARMLHYSSNRESKPFVAINCAAMPKELIESELFGYEKGAFTGAASRRIGKFEEAGDGTIFLDEIGELDLPLQAKLLRVLQEKEIERIGSNKKIRVNFRLISSTNRDLKSEIAANNFREDLFYRLNVVQIHVPPLRERKDDIPLLTTEFVNDFCTRENKLVTVSDEVMDAFMNFHWPGNVRQLRNTVERAVVLARGKNITTKELPDDFIFVVRPNEKGTNILTLRELESQAIRNALEGASGNKSKVAKLLGISRKALYKRLSDFGIDNL
jgi:DNA-binding NtrC family response regulator